MTASSRTGNGSGTSSGSDVTATLRAKRALDVAVSGSLLVLLAPVWAAVLGAVGLDMLRCPRDRGPLFYRESRVSGGRPFRLLKFRTLRRDVLAVAAGHVRPYEADAANLTWAGRRVLKPVYLDELPQLVNVLRGEMRLVGPRPEVPRYVALYTPTQRRVLDLVPGITDPASVRFVHESDELAAAAADAERLYVTDIMPEKIRLNLDYAARANAWTDLSVVLATVRQLVVERPPRIAPRARPG